MASLLPRTARRMAVLVMFITGWCLLTTSAMAQISTLQFSYGTRTYSSIQSTGTQIMYPTVDDGTTGSYGIGFTFTFEGGNYTTFNASSNGLLGLGGTVTTAYSNSLPQNYGYPVITPMWDDLYVRSGNGIWYQVTGTSPRRVLTVEWYVEHISSSGGQNYQFQVKLYEGTNQVEMLYGSNNRYTGQSASIGMFTSSSNYVSINPGTPPTVSYSSSYNSINTPPDNGTYYSFSPCQGNVRIAGIVSGGGTSGMANGDTILTNASLTMGGSATFSPFSLNVGPLVCSPLSYSMSISGPAAADYSITPVSGGIGASTTITPVITFVPRGGGRRYALLTVQDNNGLNVTYVLAATGLPRISWTGNIAQGGTSALADKDTLMANVGVNRGQVGTFTPFTLRNFSTNSTLPLAQITYQLTDPTGQYSIAPTGDALNAGQSSTPVITFRATGLGNQPATLVVTADNEVRRYVLYAVSKAPQLRFIGDEDITSDMMVLHRNLTCAGEQVVSMPIQINNFGLGNAVITGAGFYKIDTNNTLPLSQKPLLRDSRGRVVPAVNFQLSLTPGVAPIDHSTDVTFPFTIAAGTTRTFYLNFVGEIPGRPIAKFFFWSDAQNITNADTAGVVQTGIMSFLIGPRVIGGRLAGAADGTVLKPLVFGPTKLGNTATKGIVVFNAGECDLRISRRNLIMQSGDLREFSFVSVLRNTRIDPATDTYVIPPQGKDTIIMAFHPDSRGGRRVTLRLETNDSTIYLPGLTERGVRYLDVFGEGATDLTGPGLYLGQVLVGDTITATATIENPNLVPIIVSQITFTGTDAAEFTEDPANPWPALPYEMRPNERLNLSIRWISAGSPGRRSADLVLRNATGIVGSLRIGGEAGTRELTVLPLSLFDGVNLRVGQIIRRQVAITNTGTFDVRLQAPTLGGNDPGNYVLGRLPRPIIAPGTTEYLEVTFSPTTSGPSSATIDIVSNATNSPATVTLGGESMEIRPDDEQGSERVREGGNPTEGVAGVEAELRATGMSVRIAPNPATDRVEARVSLVKAGALRGTLVDGRGEVVRSLGTVSAPVGASVVTFNVADLPAGAYALRLEGDGTSSTVRFVVAR